MNCSRNLFTMGAMFLLAVSPALRAEDATEKGVKYLVSRQAEDGSWNSDEKLKLTDSSESFQALMRTRGGESALNKSLQFFSALPDENNEMLAYKLIVLSSSTATIDNYVNKLIANQKADGGWGIADSKTGSIPYTLLSVNSLLSSKKASNSVISDGIAFLIKNQQANGSWIFSGEHSLSDTAHTAMVLVVLKNVQNANLYTGSGLEQAVAKAQQYIQGKADNDGSYGDLLDTAWTYLAFSLIKQPSELQSTLSFISSSQKENGSWNDQIYDTAVCLQALTAIQTPQSDLPDLEITEANITFNPTAPLTGNEVSISAVIFNKGEVDAENVKIEFFNRDPRLNGVEIATSKIVPLVPAGGSVAVSSSFISTDMVGAQQIVVFVDRENAINEVTKVNNAAAKILTVGGMPDLAISVDDITLSNPNPKAFETVDLIVTINNIGNEAVQNIPVKIFDNDKLFYEFILSGVNAGSSNKAIVTTGFSAETHVIRVEVDPEHTINSEVNVANNIASKSFTVEAESDKPVDLAVLSIETDPAAPLSTAPTKITVTIANLGGQDVTAAFAVVLNVDGVAKGTINVPQLLKGQRAILEFTGIMLTAGEKVVAAVADSGNVITEDTERGNNTLSKTITVRDSSTPVDLELVSLIATPATATVGGAVSFKVIVTNKGTITAENVDVKLFNGTTAISSVKVPRLVGGQSGELQFEYIFNSNGNYTIRAVADPDNKITESDKTNNEKSAAVAVTGATDLEITAANIVLSADSVTAFQQFEITAVIKNIGNMDAVNVPVRFIANGNTLATMNLSGVSAGGSNKAILKTSLAKGTYNITVSIDPDKTLANEHNLTNNVAYKSLVVTAPTTTLADLAVTSLVIDPALPIANTPANLTATVANLGGSDIATSFSVEFKDNDTVLHTFTVPGLTAGQKAELKLSANLTAGDHTILINADSGNVITEASKANNSASKQISVASDATPVDLQVSSVTLDKASPNVMDKVVVTASIYNAGTTAAGSFFIRVMANGNALGEDYKVTSLVGGGTFNLQIPYTVSKEGENVIQIIADSQNNVEESDKTNNSGSVNFSASTIARPDLTIPNGGLATSPENPQPSVSFEYKITVANIGNEASTAAKLIVTEGHPQMAGAVKLGEAAIPAIEAGKQTTVSVTLKLAESSENIFVFVDSDEAVAESNEDNNLFKTSITVANLPDLMVDKNAISLSHTDLAQGKIIEIKAVVANIGSVNAAAVKGRFIDRRIGGATYLIGEVSIPAIAAGENAEVKTLWTATGGVHTILFEVDYDNALTESSKSNNIAEKDINMTVPETTLRILSKNPESGEYFTNNQFSSYETVYFEVLHGYSDSRVVGILEDAEGNTYRILSQAEMLQFSTSYNAPGTYNAYFAVMNMQTGVIEDEIEGTFSITSRKRLESITPSSKPTRATAQENNILRLTAEVVNKSNEPVTGTLTFKLTKPDGTAALENMVHEVTIRPDQFLFRYTQPEFEYIFTEVGDYVLTTELVSEVGTFTKTKLIPVYEITPLGINPSKLDVNLPLGEQIQSQIELIRDSMVGGEKFDVVFMFDTTGSFWGTIEQFKQSSLSIMDSIKEQLGDVQFGLSSFADFPIGEWGSWDDYAYMMNHSLTSDTQAIRDAFDSVRYGDGWDGLESQLEALFQLATGKGRDINGNGNYTDRGDIPPQNMGWRPGSTRIVFFATDIDFHRPGDWGGEDWCPLYPGASWEETVEALRNAGIILVGLMPHGVTDVVNMVTEVGSVDENGNPLIFNYGYSGSDIAQAVLKGVSSATAFNITFRAVDDEMGFFKGVEPESIRILPGENADFEIKLEGVVEQGPVDQIFTFEVEIVAQGGRVIGRVPVTILVPQRIPLKVTTDKTQYVVGENVLVDVNLELTGNALKSLQTQQDFNSGTFDRISALLRPNKLILDVFAQTAPANILVNGDFESYDNWWNIWQVKYADNTYIERDIWDWDVISGNMSMYVHFEYYGYENPQPGESSVYQTVKIPKGAVTAKVSWKDRVFNGGVNYKVQLRDINDNVLKTLFAGDINSWEATQHEADVSEYIGREVRVAFVLDPQDRNGYAGFGAMLDDVSLNITYPSYYPQGTAKYIIDGERMVIWDKLIYEAEIPENTSISVRTRSADSVANLEYADYSSASSGNQIKITSESSRYLEVEITMTTADEAITPELSALQVIYGKYSASDNLKLKVFIEDAEGKLVKELAEFVPQVQFGQKQNFKYQFDSHGYLPGDYKAIGRLFSNNTLEGEDSANFKLITDAVASLLESSISTDKLEYIGNETVQITSRVKNTSANANLNNLTVLVEVKDSTDTVVQSYTYQIDPLFKGSINDKALQFAVSNDSGIGPYTVTQTVTMDGIEPLVKITPFTVKASAELGKGLTGTLTPQPLSVKRRIGDLDFAITAANGGNVDLNDVLLKVTIYDPATLTAMKTISSSGVAMPKTGTHGSTLSYGGKVELMPGTYPAILTAEFTYNGSAQIITLDTAGFIVTNTPPVANAGSDIAVTTYAPAGASVALNGSASTDENSTDAALKNDIVKYEWKKGETLLGTGETLNVTLAAGVHEITLTVTDTCGATHSDTVKVTVTQMILPPTITDLTPAHNTIVKELALGAKATDAVWGIDWATLIFKSGEQVLTASYDGETGKITSALPENSADGWYDLNIFVKNQGGAEATTPAWRVGLDRTPPVITEAAPSADVYVNNGQPSISGKLADAFSGIDAATIKVTVGETTLEHTFNAETGVVTAAVPEALADGWHNAKIEVADKVGNLGSYTWRLGVDLTPPTITSMKPEANTEINSASQEISAVISDELSGIKADTIVLKVNGETVVHTYDVATGKVSYSASGMETGEQTVTISVSDNAGNSSSATWKFNVQLRVAGSEYLLFHNSKNGELTITGGDKTINGLAHSNAAIKIRGNHTTITGQTTATGSISINGNSHNVALQQANAPELPMPVYPYEYYVANATQVINGGLTIAKGQTLQPGIYLVNGDVTIRESTLNVTIVATGNIKISSKDVSITHADEKYKVALYSKNGSIDSSANGLTVTGVVYAPSGTISVQSNDSNFTGAIVADKVEFNGQNLTLNPLQY